MAFVRDKKKYVERDKKNQINEIKSFRKMESLIFNNFAYLMNINTENCLKGIMKIRNRVEKF